MKVSYIINIVYLLHVSATHVAILGDVHYKEWIYQEITKFCEIMHRCKYYVLRGHGRNLAQKWAKYVGGRFIRYLYIFMCICWFHYHSITLVYINIEL